MSKPHIYRFSSKWPWKWVCYFAGRYGLGTSPTCAFRDLVKQFDTSTAP